MKRPLKATRFFDDLEIGEEFVSRWYEATEKELINFAGLDHKVNLMHGSAEEIIPKLNFNADFVFIDHAKKKYLSDLKLLESEGIIVKNSVVFADNVGIFKDEMAEYFDHVRESGEYLSQNFSSKLEYRNNIYDAVEISIKN